MLWWNLGSDEDGAAGLLKERMFETEWYTHTHTIYYARRQSRKGHYY